MLPLKEDCKLRGHVQISENDCSRNLTKPDFLLLQERTNIRSAKRTPCVELRPGWPQAALTLWLALVCADLDLGMPAAAARSRQGAR